MALVTYAATESGPELLTGDDPSPVQIVNPRGASSFLLLGDHAGNAIPACLGTLGLSDSDRLRHIAWDLGVAEVGRRLADGLDAVFIAQAYSRLVIDCNRDPNTSDAVVETSDGSVVPGNRALGADDRRQRIDAVHRPYHDAIRDEIDRRAEIGQATVLIALHSFTPTMAGVGRPWHIGILYDGGDDTYAKALLGALSGGDLTVAANQPYQMDGTDYTVPRHAYPARLPYAEIELRQDMLTNSAACDAISRRLMPALAAALRPR